MSDNFQKLTNWQEEFLNFNNDLEEKILAANHDDSKVKWSKLLPELMGSEIFVAGQLAEGQTDENGNPRINIMMVQNNNHTLIPFFTSPERLSVLVKPDNNQFDVMKLKTANFFMSVNGQATVMNPMSNYSRVFTPFEMKILSAEYLENSEEEKKDA